MALYIKPAQLRELIDKVRTQNLLNDHILEQAEAIADHAPGYFREAMLGDVERVRAYNRVSRQKTRAYLEALEKILKEDEANNGWKGDDRYINLAPGAGGHEEGQGEEGFGEEDYNQDYDE